MITIVGTGLSGLVGSRVVELLSSEFTFENLSLETGVDITDYASVARQIETSDAPWVFHLAAYTDVQGAEKERSLGEESTAWKVNVLATENIVSLCRKTAKRLLYFDTDYAFDGKKEFYTEEDTPHPLGWYAVTKYEGAKRALSLGDNGLVVRIANPYRAHPVGKKDFIHKILERLKSGQPVVGATDQAFVPTFIDDIAYALQKLVTLSASGIYHVVGSTALSPYKAALRIAEEFGCDRSLVEKTTFTEFFANRAPIPQHAYLKNDKIQKLGVKMLTFEEGLQEVKRQEEGAEQ